MNRILLLLTLFAFTACLLLFYALATRPTSTPTTATVAAATNLQYRDVDFIEDLEGRIEALEGYIIDLEDQMYDLELHVERVEESLLNEIEDDRLWLEEIEYRLSELELVVE